MVTLVTRFSNPASHKAARSKQQRWPERVGRVVAIGLAAILGLQLAWWTWHFVAPLRFIAAPAVTPAPDLSAAKTLFGESARAPAGKPGPNVTTSVGTIRLKGVFAVNGKTLSAAVINLGGRDQVVRVDEPISEGVTLVEVAADRIVVSRNGVRETVELDRSGRHNVATGPAGTQTASAPGFRLNIAATSNNGYSMSRNELNNVLQDPRQIEHLGRIGAGPGGGVRIDEARPGTLVEKLGLKTGDIIVSLNGQPVNGPGDLAKLYGQFSTLSHVRAEVRRNGAPMLLTYAINQ